MLSTAPLTVSTKKELVIRGYLYASGRLCGSLESWRIVRDHVHFEVIPSTLAFHAHTTALSHIALVYKGTLTIVPVVSGFTKDGVARYSLDHNVTIPSPECPGLRLPSLVRL